MIFFALFYSFLQSKPKSFNGLFGDRAVLICILRFETNSLVSPLTSCIASAILLLKTCITVHSRFALSKLKALKVEKCRKNVMQKCTKVIVEDLTSTPKGSAAEPNIKKMDKM